MNLGSDTTGPLPEPLRTVLGSRQKLELLCLLDDGPATSNELVEALAGKGRVNGVNLHLNALRELGWVKIDGVSPSGTTGPDRSVWALATDPGWRALVATNRAQAPKLTTAAIGSPA